MLPGFLVNITSKVWQIREVYPDTFQLSKTELFVKIVKGFQLLTISAKMFHLRYLTMFWMRLWIFFAFLAINLWNQLAYTNINPFWVNVLILYPLIKPQNLKFSKDINGTLTSNELMTATFKQICKLFVLR